MNNKTRTKLIAITSVSLIVVFSLIGQVFAQDGQIEGSDPYGSEIEKREIQFTAGEAGVSEWIYQSEEGVQVLDANGGPAITFPSSFRWLASTADEPKVLLFASDVSHPPPNTFPDQALQALGMSYEAHYNGDFSNFESALTGGSWDVVIFANDLIPPPVSVFNALNTYVSNGGRLIMNTWQVSVYPGHSLWETLGFTFVSDDNDPPDSIYWWQYENSVFLNPRTVPEFDNLTSVSGGWIYGQRMEPLPGFDALGGYTIEPEADEAGLIVGNNNRTIFRGFQDSPNSADQDTDSMLDGIELWINMLYRLGIPAAKLYFSKDIDPNGLYTLDTTSGVGTLVGAGESGVSGTTVGLSLSPEADILFGSTWMNIAQISIDGSSSVTFPGDTEEAEGLAFNPATGIFFGAINGDFFEIDPQTGLKVQDLAAPGFDAEGLAADPVNNLVYATGNQTQLAVYNVADDSWSTVGDTGINWFLGGLAFDYHSDVLYVVGLGGGNNLYKINPNTASATLVGATGLTPTNGGLAYSLVTDLSLSKEAEVTYSKPESVLSYRLTVRNDGLIDATHVVLIDTLPIPSNFISVIPGAPTCIHSAGIVECDLGNIEAGGSGEIQIEVMVPTPDLVTSVTNTAEVMMIELDSYPDNNLVSESTIMAPGGFTNHDCNNHYNPIGNCSFETGDFTDWLTEDLSFPFWDLEVDTSGISPGFGLFTSDPTHGNDAALHGFDGDGPGFIRIAQDVNLPDDAGYLLFDYRVGWDMENFAIDPLPRHFQVRIESSGGGPTLGTIPLLTAPSETFVGDSGNLTGRVDIGDFQGQAVRIIFEWEVPENYTGPAFFQLDNVQVIKGTYYLPIVMKD